MSARPRPRIVIAEDDALLRVDARLTLEDAGFDVIEAEDAAAALETIETRDDIDVVFTDVQMPGPLCGLELTRRLHVLRPEVPVFVTSGQASECEAKAVGCRGFFPKPYAIDRVVDRLLAEVA